MDGASLPAQAEAALGFFGGSNWAPDLDMVESAAFVAACEQEYGPVPGVYAMQGYDTARLIDAPCVRRAAPTATP